jgi:hypothetical protein
MPLQHRSFPPAHSTSVRLVRLTPPRLPTTTATILPAEHCDIDRAYRQLVHETVPDIVDYMGL